MGRVGVWITLAAALVACEPEGPSTIGGRAYTTWFGEHDEVKVPMNLTYDLIQVLIPDESGEGFSDTLTPTLGAEGSYETREIVSGLHYLVWRDGDGGPFQIVVDDDDEPNPLTFSCLGRPGPRRADGASVRFHLSNLRAWSSSHHRLSLYVPNLRAHSFYVFDEPLNGQTEATVSPGYLDHLIEATEGDRIYVAQHRRIPDEETGHEVIARFGTVSRLDMDVGTSYEVELELEEPSANRRLDFTLDTDARYQLVAEAHPDATPGSNRAFVHAMPGSSGRLLGGAPIVASWYGDSGIGTTDVDFEFSDPFPGSWQRYVDVRSYASVGDVAQDAGLRFSVAARITCGERFDPDTPLLVTPPQQLRIDDRDAWLDEQEYRLTPTISWSAPRVTPGDDVRYQVSVFHGFGFQFFPQQSVADFYTRDTSVQVPPGVLEAGRSYRVLVWAVAGSRCDRGHAAVVSSRFSAAPPAP
jgi:hypothetical protein